MSRLDAKFLALSQSNRSALITFVTAGDPSKDSTVSVIEALVEGGADIVELGVPFSDPEADGPAIQKSSERALKNGMTLRQTCDVVEQFRKQNQTTPIVLMGYLNPILSMGVEPFAKLASTSGVDGIIVVNLPPEEAAEVRRALEAVDISLVMLVAPTTTQERIREIVQVASGFVYYVSIKGITGANHLVAESVVEKLQSIRSETDLPVAVGFGIKTPDVAREIAQVADGVVVGSSLVESIASAKDSGDMIESLTRQVSDLRRAVDLK